MKILHVMLSNFYIDDAFYQENMLSIQNKMDGHQVMIIASTMIFGDGNSTRFISPSTYYTTEGIIVIRIPYIKVINNKISEKIRAYKNLYALIEEFSPDLIFSHGIGGYFSNTIGKYIKKNQKTKLFIDTHSDYFNSATNFFSKNILHRLFYRYYFWKYVKYAEKVFYVAPDSVSFLNELYDFEDQEKLHYMPLGGYIINELERVTYRENIRRQLNIPDEDIILIYTGKMGPIKKSFELLNAFTKVEANNIWLLILGVFTEDVYQSVKAIIDSDQRILYLGWKSGSVLREYLCASDIYMQPGARSVSVQNAVCCGCGIIVNPSLVYTHLFGKYGLYAESEEEIKNLLEKIIEDPQIIDQQRESLMIIAKKKLDYRVLANFYTS